MATWDIRSKIYNFVFPIHLYLCHMEHDGGRSKGVLLAASENTLTHTRKTSLPYRTRSGSHVGDVLLVFKSYLYQRKCHLDVPRPPTVLPNIFFVN